MSDGLISQHVLLKADFSDREYFTILLIKQINYGTARKAYLKTCKKNNKKNPTTQQQHTQLQTGPDGAVAMSTANGLVGTGFTSWYRLQPRAGF